MLLLLRTCVILMLMGNVIIHLVKVPVLRHAFGPLPISFIVSGIVKIFNDSSKFVNAGGSTVWNSTPL